MSTIRHVTHRYGLIGMKIDYSLSPSIFREIFRNEGLDHSHRYELWPFSSEEEVNAFLRSREFAGCNVTIPFKKTVVRSIDELEGYASDLGVVNTIVNHGGRLIGYNTDVSGVLKTFSYLQDMRKNAVEEKSKPRRVLILGSGGASQAVHYACGLAGWPCQVLSRQGDMERMSYSTFANECHLRDYDIIINCTPLGMLGFEEKVPMIDLDQISSQHQIFDLVYAPRITRLMREARLRGAQVINGEYMLRKQAEKAWEIFKEPR